MRSNRRKQKGVGEWMVAQMVIPLFISPLTTLITCTHRCNHACSWTVLMSTDRRRPRSHQALHHAHHLRFALMCTVCLCPTSLREAPIPFNLLMRKQCMRGLNCATYVDK